MAIPACEERVEQSLSHALLVGGGAGPQPRVDALGLVVDQEEDPLGPEGQRGELHLDQATLARGLAAKDVQRPTCREKGSSHEEGHG